MNCCIHISKITVNVNYRISLSGNWEISLTTTRGKNMPFASASAAARPATPMSANWATPGATAPRGALQTAAPGAGYGAFNARTAANSNKYLQGTALNSPFDLERFKGIGSDLYGKLFGGPGAPGLQGGGGEGAFSFSSGYGGPNDPNLKGHLANLMGEPRRMLNNYVPPNSSRAGLGPVTGADPASSSAYQMAKALSESYGNQYKTAADLTYRDNSMYNDRLNSAMSLLSSIYGNDAGLQKSAADFALGQGRIGVDLNQQALAATQGQEAFNEKKYFDDTNYARGADERAWQKRQQAQQESVWNKSKADMQAKERQTDIDKYLVQRQNWRGHGGGWMDSGIAGDAAMRLAGAEGRDWWRDPARGGGGGGGAGRGDNSAAQWAGFTSGLLRGAGA